MSVKRENVTAKKTQLAYPFLHLLYNLIISGKLFRREFIKGGKEVLKPTDRFEAYKSFNSVEKYITLIEILWVDCDFEKLRFQSYDHLNPYSVAMMLKYIFSDKGKQGTIPTHLMEMCSSILLYFSYLGLLEVEVEEEMKKGYESERMLYPSGIKISDIGLNILNILNKSRALDQWNISYKKENGQWKIEFKEEFSEAFKGMFEEAELKKSLPRKGSEVKQGIYTFKVYIAKNIWVKMQLDGKHTLDDLHDCIQDAFDFDNDHMYSFFMDGRPWSHDKFTCPQEDEGPHADEVKIEELSLTDKQTFVYLFDYGDEWTFLVEVYSIEEADSRLLIPQVIETKGKPPKQYADFD
ncbi:IS1096 element passenger TnpR family protein [Clostridium manihotivorum]|uniref:Plasmid pRiA4b Orf3-like domain-containing protein n=1 Tax=Clostridium manihotivorum TaxID=2320868 RepID=A0A3R5QW06_9CLOT|nr:hypothetical protein [Clostridium manihotivorum]QAA33562.1 hypothetical protein C1I91_19015 [Clostridium manihotivorum]